MLGKDKKTLTGFSSTMVKAHNGAIFNCDLIQQTPPDLRQKAMRVISGKYAVWPRARGRPTRTLNHPQRAAGGR